MAKKNYQDLKTEVWEKGQCAGCGACIAVCPADAFYFTAGVNSLYPEHTGYCKEVMDGVSCGICYEVCPRVNSHNPQKKVIGEYLNIAAAKAAFNIEGKQSGGAVTAILLNAFEQGLIDAVVTVTEDKWTHHPASVVITSSNILIQQAGSRYNWWVPLTAALKEAVITKKYRRIAVVGLPCVTDALKKIRESKNQLLMPYQRAIRLVIGLFCTESFDYHKFIEEKLGREYDIPPWKISRMDVKGKFDLILSDGQILSLSLKEIEECVRPGCHFCSDFAANNADISAGAVGSEEGFTTLIIRTSIGQGFVDSAVQSKRLILNSEIDIKAVEHLATKKMKQMA